MIQYTYTGYCISFRFLVSIELISPYRSHISTPLTYLSVECTGLEEKLTECMWTAKNAESRTTNVLLLCKEGKFGVVHAACVCKACFMFIFENMHHV